MTIQQAIEKAIEGGWNSEECAPPIGSRERFNKDRMFLDPLFWQSLGKALGWGNYRGKSWESMSDEERVEADKKSLVLEYMAHWHRFIDHLAEGKDAESFFENLK